MGEAVEGCILCVYKKEGGTKPPLFSVHIFNLKSGTLLRRELCGRFSLPSLLYIISCSLSGVPLIT